MQYGSIEAGGTKFVLAVGDESLHVLVKEQIPTTTPEETLRRCTAFFKAHPVAALGIGSFGPIDIVPQSPTYGQILATPKPGWQGTNMVAYFEKALLVPVALTTDVNASAFGEYQAGAGKNDDSLVYFTIGTGIGGGAIQNGAFIGGSGHAEMGHAFALPRADDDFAGSCPFHGNHCFEGLAAGPSIQARTGVPGQELPRTAPVFDLISYYVAQMLFDAYVNLRPSKLVVGGSVLSAAELPKVSAYFEQFNHGYIAAPALADLIVLSQMPNNSSATVGDFALAKRALDVG
ncbi:MAG: ROK family protein [Lactobacillus sp.]|jgi:fructokinase|nr:ROK family protein [Lactobacillus sp.]MCI2032346.1 ROK family protein [Lactobacillus sp.]